MLIYEPQNDSGPAKTQISLDIHPVRSESSLSAWRKLGSLATHWAHSKGSDQTGRMPRLIWVFAGRTDFVGLSCRCSYLLYLHGSGCMLMCCEEFLCLNASGKVFTATNPSPSSHIPMGQNFLFLRTKFRNRAMLYGETFIELLNIAIRHFNPSHAAIKISINATAAEFICENIFPTPVQIKKIIKNWWHTANILISECL